MIPRPIPVSFSICRIEAPLCNSCLIVFSFSSLGKVLNSSHVVAVVISLIILSTCVSVGFGARYSFGSRHFVPSGSGLLSNARHCSSVKF